MISETVILSSTDDLVFRLTINGKECVLQEDNSLTLKLDETLTYVFHWFVWGFPGAQFSLEFKTAKVKNSYTMLYIVALLFSASQVAFTQAPVVSDEAAHQAKAAASVTDKTFEVNQTSVLSAPTSQITLEGSTKAPTAKGRLGIKLQNYVAEIKVSSPITDGADDSESVTFDGLADKAQAGVGLTRFFLKFSANDLE